MTSRLAPGSLPSVAGVRPDLTTLGKYVGGGMSFGAFGGRGEIIDRFDPRRFDALPHAGTFNNNVLTMAAGLAGLSAVYTPQAAVALNAQGDALRTRLNALCGDAPLQIHRRGSHAGGPHRAWCHCRPRRIWGICCFWMCAESSGIVQVVFNKETQPEAHAKAEQARSEFVVAVEGKVTLRGKANPELATGEVEIVAGRLHILNNAEDSTVSD